MRTLTLALLFATSFLAVNGSAADDLVQRDAVKLNLAGAETILDAAKAKADAMGLKVNIAVVDNGGHLLAFARMDGARPASSYTARSKAVTAALKLGDTGPTVRGDAPPDPRLNIAIENAASMSGGTFTTLNGGVAIAVDGQIIGGIGVGGATGAQDTEIGRAGLDALLQALGGQ